MSDEADLLARFPTIEGAPYPHGSAYAQLPLTAYGRALGALSVIYRGPNAFAADERALLHALAAQIGIALARAQLYEREHAVAQTLQASLLPRELPDVPGLDLAGRLEAGATASTSAATSTTRSRSPMACGGSRSATSAARASTPRR